MQVPEELIYRFFQGQCTPAEAKEVLKYLQEDPAAADQYLNRQEWDRINSSDSKLTEEQSARMLQNIRSAIDSRSNLIRFKNVLAVAASLLLILTSGILVYRAGDNIPAPNLQVGNDLNWRTIKNPSDSIVHIALREGTAVELWAGSALSFQDPFPSDRRDVKLSGKAYFTVAKDRMRPFTVYSGHVSTTALGTAFTINAFRDNRTSSILLHEGRVKVKDLRGHGKEYFLLPDQELVYDNQSGSVSIQKIPGGSNTSILAAKVAKPASRQTGIAISFERKPLTEVFEKLEAAYHTDLDYTREGLNDYFFTGEFNTTDSLERVLRVVTETNHLQFIKTRSGYRITKKR